MEVRVLCSDLHRDWNNSIIHEPDCRAVVEKDEVSWTRQSEVRSEIEL